MEAILNSGRLSKEQIFKQDRFGFTFAHYSCLDICAAAFFRWIYVRIISSLFGFAAKFLQISEMKNLEESTENSPRLFRLALSSGFDINMPTAVGGYTPLMLFGEFVYIRVSWILLMTNLLVSQLHPSTLIVPGPFLKFLQSLGADFFATVRQAHILD